MQNKNLKLKLGLCGLALTSFLALNAHSIVHADTVQNSNVNNNAITWDSDNDDSQVVKEQSQQDKSSRPAQSNVQVSYSQPVQNKNVMVSNVSSALSSQSVQNRAEKSIVRQSNFETSTVNRLNANTARLQVKIAHLNDAVPANRVVINNPQNNQVIVHYVKSNGQSADLADQTIDVTKIGQGSYMVPNGYSLNNPDGKYNVNGGKFNGTNMHATTNYHAEIRGGQLTNDELAKADYEMYPSQSGSSTISSRGGSDGTLFEPSGVSGDRYHPFTFKYIRTGNDGAQYYQVLQDLDGIPSSDIGSAFSDAPYYFGTYHQDYMYPSDYVDQTGLSEGVYIRVLDKDTKVTQPAYTTQTLPIAFVDANNNIVGMIQNYTGKVGTTQNVNLTLPTGYKLADGVTLPTSVTFQKSDAPLLIKVVSNGQTNSVQNPANNQIHVNFVDQTTGKDAGGDYDIDLTKMQNGTNYYATPNGYVADNGGAFESKHFIKTYKVPTRTGVTLSDGAYFYDSWQNYGSATPVDAINQIFKTLGASDATKLSVSLSYAPILYDDDGYTYTGVQIKNDTNGKTCIVSEDKRYASDWQRVAASALVQHLVDDDYGNATYLTGHVILTRTPLTYSSSFTDNYHTISDGTVTVPVHKTNSFTFSDNTGNVKSVVGNVVNVVVTKPEAVNDASQTRKSATRVISVNLPDDQGARDRYKGMLNSNNQIVQTINFTRSVTQDALTGNVLSETNWQGPSSFPAVTLPDIPGYTMTMN